MLTPAAGTGVLPNLPAMPLCLRGVGALGAPDAGRCERRRVDARAPPLRRTTPVDGASVLAPVRAAAAGHQTAPGQYKAMRPRANMNRRRTSGRAGQRRTPQPPHCGMHPCGRGPARAAGRAPAAGRDGADVRALQHRLVDHAGVVVQPARQAEVERDRAQRALAAQLAEQRAQVAQRGRRVRVARQRVVCAPRAPAVRAAGFFLPRCGGARRARQRARRSERQARALAPGARAPSPVMAAAARRRTRLERPGCAAAPRAGGRAASALDRKIYITQLEPGQGRAGARRAR